MQLLKSLPFYGEALVRLFYPSLCVLCEKLLELDEKGICLSCLNGLEKFKLAPAEERIRVKLADTEEGWALFRYDGAIKELLHQVKFARRRDLLGIFSQAIFQFIQRQQDRLMSYDCLIPIPLDPARRLAREFNQSSLIARMIQTSFRRKIALKHGVLIKCRSTSPQSLLGRESRSLNLERVFRIGRPERVRNKSVLLIDDVFTTGATVEQAAKTLKSSGVGAIGYITLARAFQD